MRYFRLPNFSGIEDHRSDTDRGTLRISEDCMNYPPGCLQGGPVWREVLTLGASSSLEDKMGSYGGTDTDTGESKSLHYFMGDDGNARYLRMIGHWGSIGAKEGHDVTGATSDSTAKTAGAVRGAGVIGGKTVFAEASEGAYTAGGMTLITSFANSFLNFLTVTEQSDLSKQIMKYFEGCDIFTTGPGRRVFAASTARTDPLVVYVSEAPGVSNTDMRGYASSALSKVEIQSSNATRIRALSAYGHYVLVHTDAGVTVLTAGQSVDQDMTGWRVPQQSSGVKEGAASQSVVGWDQSLPYYLSADGNIYKAAAVTASTEENRDYSEPDQVTWKSRALLPGYFDSIISAGAGGAGGLVSNQVTAAFEPESGTYAVNSDVAYYDDLGGYTTYSRRRQLVMFNELTDSASGPFELYPDSFAVAAKGSSLWRLGVESTGSDPEDLLGWWKLDDASGTTAVDYTGNNDFTLTAPTWIDSGGSGHASGTKHGGAVNFNGSTTEGTFTGTLFASDPGAFTISFWMYPEDVTDVIHVIFDTHATVGGGTRLSVSQTNNRVGFTIVDADGISYTVKHAATFAADAWTHVVCVWDSTITGNTMKMYVNGVGETFDESIDDLHSKLIGSQRWHLGRLAASSSNHFHGTLDDVRIQSVALDSDAVTAAYNSGTGDFAALAAAGDTKLYATDLRTLREPLWYEGHASLRAADSDAPKAYYSADGEFAWGAKRLVNSPFADEVTINNSDPATAVLSTGQQGAFGRDPPNTTVDDAVVAWFETDWLHMGDEHNMKQLHEVILTFDQNSRGHLLVFAENESGVVRGQSKGEIFGTDEQIKVFLNLRGRRFRFRVFMVTHRWATWRLREMALGYIQGKSH